MDDNEKVALRRYTRNVYCSGVGFILFGAWDAVKYMMTLYSESNDPDGDMRNALIALGNYWFLLYFILLIVAAIILIFHILVGRGAMNFAQGKTEKKRFLIVAYIILIATLLSLPFYFITGSIKNEVISIIEWLNTFEGNFSQLPPGAVSIASFLTDLTMIYLMSDMIYSTGKVTKLRVGAK